MTLAKVVSCAVIGLDGELVDVEVDVANGPVGFHLVGLPDVAVQEAIQQVRIGDLSLPEGVKGGSS